MRLGEGEAMTTIADRVKRARDELVMAQAGLCGDPQYPRACIERALAELPNDGELSNVAPMVLASDYEKLKAENERLRQLANVNLPDLETMKQAVEQRDALEAALEKIKANCFVGHPLCSVPRIVGEVGE